MIASNARRQHLIEYTEVLWSVAIYVPTTFFAGFLIVLLDPLRGPYDAKSIEMGQTGTVILSALIALCAVLVIRHQVWRPLRKLYTQVGDRALFGNYCAYIITKALPYVPLTAVPMALICLSFGSWLMYVQIGLIIAADHLVESLRKRPIATAVDMLIARI